MGSGPMLIPQDLGAKDRQRYGGNKEETERGFEASDIYRLITPARGLPAPSVSCEKALQRLRAMSAVREVEPRLADPFFSATLRPSLSTQQAATKGRVKHLFGR